MAPSDLTDRAVDGLAVRRRVLGDAYVDKSLEAATDFSAPLQDFVHENCWGLVWTREALDLKTRSMITLSALAGSGKWSEFTTHARGALNNGWTLEELRELVFHLAVYLGVPTALEAFRALAPLAAEHTPTNDLR